MYGEFFSPLRIALSQIRSLERTVYQTFLRHKSTRPVRKKTKSEKRLAKAFVDICRVRVQAGKGGNGCLSFLSLPFNEWAGPDGGDGGNGGHVIFQADKNTNSLSHVRRLYRASDGENGQSHHCFGKNANHTIIKVPVGTVIKSEDGMVLAALEFDEHDFIACRGGAGGKGNHFFLTNENRAPTVYEEGGKGEERLLYAELRVMAHVGLVGFPNAGKSTLLRAITRAQPQVASYAFTTLRPHIGIVEYENNLQISVADLPGLIKGAHLNYGLGFAFLRHIERCRCLLYVLDMSVEAPWEQLTALRFELEKYQEGLSRRPHAVIANKMDTQKGQENLLKLQEHDISTIFPVSAKRKINLGPLLYHIRDLYEKDHN